MSFVLSGMPWKPGIQLASSTARRGLPLVRGAHQQPSSRGMIHQRHTAATVPPKTACVGLLTPLPMYVTSCL